MPITASIVTLEFFLHCGLIHSERLGIQATWRHDAIEFTTNRRHGSCPSSINPNLPRAPACGAALPHPLMPTNLAIGDALSMAASCATCHLYTRAHIVHAVSVEAVGQAWQETVAFVGRSIAHCGFRSVQAVAARATVVACFVERVASSHFNIGIVTQKSVTTAEGALAVQDVDSWVRTCQLSPANLSYFAELPMCKPQRATSLRFWVEQATQQVSVGHAVPPVHVAVRHVWNACGAGGGSPVQTPHDGVAFSCVRLFLTRPVEGSIGGVTQLPVMPQRRYSPIADGKPGDASSATASHHTVQSFYPVNGKPASPSSYAITTVAANGETVLRETFVFDNVVVSASGETLIGVECCVHEAYRPFVAPILQFVPPFLVLG